MGGAYSLLPARARSLSGGTVFGLGVWSASYAGWLPHAGLMPRPLWDRPGRPTAMLLAHLVFGATLAGVVRGMSTRHLAPPVAE